MKPYQREFLEFAIACGALRFGSFTLKSGRISPYFFNSGLFNTGAKLGRLADFYAHTIESSGVTFDMLYGPAYKGIPLAAATAIAFYRLTGRDLPYAFNRKEAKDHGEGGATVGAPLLGRVLVVDDVISAGTSVRESVVAIKAAGATPVAVAIALDRQERGDGNTSATEEVQRQAGLAAISIVTLRDLIRYLEGSGERAHDLAAMEQYRQQYGVFSGQ